MVNPIAPGWIAARILALNTHGIQRTIVGPGLGLGHGHGLGLRPEENVLRLLNQHGWIPDRSKRRVPFVLHSLDGGGVFLDRGKGRM
nr:hypothetical protein [Candidatus Sigynarchaeum springense]